jgi:hypothetical protein
MLASSRFSSANDGLASTQMPSSMTSSGTWHSQALQSMLRRLFSCSERPQKGPKQQAAPIHPSPSLDESSSPTSDSTESPRATTSCILLARFGGLVRGVDANTKESNRSIIAALDRVGSFDILTSIIIFRHLVYPRSGNVNYSQIDKLINIASKDHHPRYVLVPMDHCFHIGSAGTTLAHLLLSHILSNSRAVADLERLSPKMEDLVRWIKAQYARVPETLRWVLERCYFSL